MNIFVCDRPADRRRMHPNLLRDLLDHHRFQPLLANLQKLRLPLHDRLARPHNRVLPLLDISQQLNRRLIPLLHILLDLLLRLLLLQHLAIPMVQPERRHVVLVHQHHVHPIALHKRHIRLDQTRLRLVVPLPRPGVERPDKIDRPLYLFGRPPTALGQLPHVFLLKQTQEILNDRLRRRKHIRPIHLSLPPRSRHLAILLNLHHQGHLRLASPPPQHNLRLPPLRADLDQQALLQIARPHPHRVEVVHNLPRRRHILQRLPRIPRQRPSHLQVGRRQIAILVQIPHHQLRRGPHPRRKRQRPQLPGQMIAQRTRLRKKMLERRFVGLFKVRRRLIPRIQILLEVAAKVDLVERVLLPFHIVLPLRLRDHLLGRTLPVPLDPRPLIKRKRDLLHLLKHRILDHLRVQHLFQFEFIQGQHADHLHQSRRQHLTLRHSKIQLGLQHVRPTLPGIRGKRDMRAGPALPRKQLRGQTAHTPEDGCLHQSIHAAVVLCAAHQGQSCRTGALHGRRPLRDGYIGRATTES